jgi:hypothetical protein
VLQVYGPTIKELIHEQCGDGIMSAINFRLDVKRVPDPAGDRVGSAGAWHRPRSQFAQRSQDLVTQSLGAAHFDHAESFAMMRSGHLDICVLGAFQARTSCADDLFGKIARPSRSRMTEATPVSGCVQEPTSDGPTA